MTEQLLLSATSEFPALSLASQRNLHMMASIKAPLIQSDIRDRSPIDLVAVIDKSGSMAGEKIELVKKTCNFILKQLASTDRFSLISYDTEVQVEFGLSNMTPAEKKASATKINAIRDGSSTNLSGGLLTGLDQLINDTSAQKSQVSAVFLFTDGLANAGIRSGKELAKVVQERLKKMNNPCSIFCFGFGADHDESFLTQIADQGSGMYYFVKNEEAISTAFADALGGLLSVVAQKIQITITPVNGVRIQKTLGVIAPPKNKNKNEEDDNNEKEEENDDSMQDDEKTVADQSENNTTKKEGKARKVVKSEEKQSDSAPEEVVGSPDPLTIDIGDLYSEEGRDVVLQLYVPAAAQPTDQFELASIKLTYFDTRSEVSQETSVTCTVQRKSEISSEEHVRTPEVDKQINRLLAAECMDLAKVEASNGNLAKAREMLTDTMNVIKKSVSSDDPLCQELVSDLQSIFDTLKSEQSWNNVGAKSVAWISKAHRVQRAAGKGGKGYLNKSKKDMIEAAQNDMDFNADDEDDEEMMQDFSANKSDKKRKFDAISRGKGGKGLGKGGIGKGSTAKPAQQMQQMQQPQQMQRMQQMQPQQQIIPGKKSAPQKEKSTPVTKKAKFK